LLYQQLEKVQFAGEIEVSLYVEIFAHYVRFGFNMKRPVSGPLFIIAIVFDVTLTRALSAPCIP
jgi:hypothetical protein